MGEQVTDNLMEKVLKSLHWKNTEPDSMAEIFVSFIDWLTSSSTAESINVKVMEWEEEIEYEIKKEEVLAEMIDQFLTWQPRVESEFPEIRTAFQWEEFDQAMDTQGIKSDPEKFVTALQVHTMVNWNFNDGDNKLVLEDIVEDGRTLGQQNSKENGLVLAYNYSKGTVITEEDLNEIDKTVLKKLIEWYGKEIPEVIKEVDPSLIVFLEDLPKNMKIGEKQLLSIFFDMNNIKTDNLSVTIFNETWWEIKVKKLWIDGAWQEILITNKDTIIKFETTENWKNLEKSFTIKSELNFPSEWKPLYTDKERAIKDVVNLSAIVSDDYINNATISVDGKPMIINEAKMQGVEGETNIVKIELPSWDSFEATLAAAILSPAWRASLAAKKTKEWAQRFIWAAINAIKWKKNNKWRINCWNL